MEPLWKLSDLTGIKREGLGPISSTLSRAEISILNDLSFFQKNSQGGKRTSPWRNTQRVTNSLPYKQLQILSTSFVIPGQGFLYFCYHWLDNNSKLSEFEEWQQVVLLKTTIFQSTVDLQIIECFLSDHHSQGSIRSQTDQNTVLQSWNVRCLKMERATDWLLFCSLVACGLESTPLFSAVPPHAAVKYAT